MNIIRQRRVWVKWLAVLTAGALPFAIVIALAAYAKAATHNNHCEYVIADVNVQGAAPCQTCCALGKVICYCPPGATCIRNIVYTTPCCEYDATSGGAACGSCTHNCQSP